MPVEVKICGLTNRDDVLAALDAGADYVGFVLYLKSPRSITPTALRRLLERVDRPLRAVGVFVNHTRAMVEQTMRDCGLFAAQLHGDETADDFAGMPGRIWRTVKLTAAAAAPDPAPWCAERYVVDAAIPGRYGGTGQTTDWRAAAQFALKHRVLLAGGLTTKNVADAVRIVHPLGVDVSSGVELRPGIKNRAEVRAFVQAARRAADR